ncbi:hypothetical protein [Achromobacter insolitus]|uniref:hypothetical protein n=1 Tax=Achromobacter insolitus TaxID=217204 RepID=UPI00174B985A|nr:hypothetical protein [Achromobacter insolitus]
MNNQIQHTHARTTSSGSGGAQPLFLEQTKMNDHATLNANILAVAIEKLLGAQARQDRRGVDVLDMWIRSQDRHREEVRKLLWTRAIDMAFSLGEEECKAGHEQTDMPALLSDVPVLVGAWTSGWNFAKKLSGGHVLALAAK